MSAHVVGLLVFASLFGAALLGMRIRAWLPGHHLSPEAKDSVRVAMGTVATMAALVLGLLVASTKGTTTPSGMSPSSWPRGSSISTGCWRCTARRPRGEGRTAAGNQRHDWPHVAGGARSRRWCSSPARNGATQLPKAIYVLAPKDDVQRALKEQAIEMVDDLGQTRWLLYEQAETSVSRAMLLVVILWLGDSLPVHRALRPAQCHRRHGADAVGGVGLRRHLPHPRARHALWRPDQHLEPADAPGAQPPRPVTMRAGLT